MPNSFELDNKLVRCTRQINKADKQKTLMVTLRSGEVFDMALLAAPAKQYKLRNVITFRRSYFGVK